MRRRLAALAGPLFVTTGVLHLLFPETYESIVPDPALLNGFGLIGGS